MLERKQSMKPESEIKWWNVINNIEDYVSRNEVATATAEALGRIKAATTNKKAAYAWSGGKDSLVIGDLCRKAGITKSFCLITELEYPAWSKFLHENKPPDCEMINVGFDLDFLANHQELLFAKGRPAQFWNKQIQAKHIEQYLANNDIDIVILGRRKIDGNSCGRDGFITKRGGKMTCSPIYDWCHELLFAYLHYNAIALPEIYRWRRGFYNGTHLWVDQAEGDFEQGCREVYEIDPSILLKAAEKIPAVKEWLEQCTKYWEINSV